MGDANTPSAFVAVLILGSASLVASALVRMARVVDRARVLATIARGHAPTDLRHAKPVDGAEC